MFCIPRFSRFLHRALRITTTSAAAFSLILSIALLAHIPAWANVWERLWLSNGESWGTGQEKGLNAAFCIFMIAGIATDWLLKRWLGECPDEVRTLSICPFQLRITYNCSNRSGTDIWQIMLPVFPMTPLAQEHFNLFPLSGIVFSIPTKTNILCSLHLRSKLE